MQPFHQQQGEQGCPNLSILGLRPAKPHENGLRGGQNRKGVVRIPGEVGH